MIGHDFLNTSMVCEQCTVNQFTSERNIVYTTIMDVLLFGSSNGHSREVLVSNLRDVHPISIDS